MKNILKVLAISLVATLTSCVNSDDYGTPNLSGECSDLTATRSTLDILASATPIIKQFGAEYDSDVIEAVVTSSDEGGNFYKSISLISVDGTKGFSMPIDDYNLYTKFEPGRKVFINLKGLFYQYNNTTSTVELGGNFGGKVGRLSGVVYREVVKRSCINVGEETIVNHLTIAQTKNNSNINKLVEIDNVQFSDASVGKTYFDPTLNPVPTFTATNHILKDANGNTLIVRFSQFANFTSKQVATGNGKIRGVLTKYNGDYQFMVRTENDIQLTGDRVGPVNPGGGTQPTAPTNLLFAGADFENWPTFLSSVNSFGLKSYAVQGIGTGALGTNSLYLNGTPTANDYVFTIKASAHLTIPVNPTKITFWVKGTAASKSLSINVYRSTDGFDAFNVGSLAGNSVTITKAPLSTTTPNGANDYVGSINTGGNWVKVTLDISNVLFNASNNGDLFALKVGKDSAFDLHIDNIEIQ
ncbi:DUF5689 domain-containing protein [Flavobacterium sp.]